MTQLPETHRQDLAMLGYTVVRNVFSREEIASYRKALQAAFADYFADGKFVSEKSQRLTPLFHHQPDPFLRLLDDPRVLDLADALLGEDCLFTGSNDGNVYAGDTVWHIDGGGLGAPTTLKFCFYTEPLAERRGCLTVLPGSHHPDFFQSLFSGFYVSQHLGIRDPYIPGATSVPTKPGDVIVFDHRLWHSAWGGSPGRMQFAYSFVAFPNPAWEETYLHGYLARINQRHNQQMLPQSLFDQASPRLKQKLGKLYEMRISMPYSEPG